MRGHPHGVDGLNECVLPLVRENGRCMLCDKTEMIRMCSTGHLRGCVVHHLSKLKNLDEDVYKCALERVPSHEKERIHHEVDNKMSAQSAKQHSKRKNASKRKRKEEE